MKKLGFEKKVRIRWYVWIIDVWLYLVIVKGIGGWIKELINKNVIEYYFDVNYFVIFFVDIIELLYIILWCKFLEEII